MLQVSQYEKVFKTENEVWEVCTEKNKQLNNIQQSTEC